MRRLTPDSLKAGPAACAEVDQQYDDDELNFRVDTSLMSSDDPCKAVLRNACDGNTQCTVQSIYDDLSGNCRTAQKVGRCLNTYTIECDGTNSPSNYCSGGAYGESKQ